MRANEEWLRKMAEAEDGCDVGVGPSITDPRQLESLLADLRSSCRHNNELVLNDYASGESRILIIVCIDCGCEREVVRS